MATESDKTRQLEAGVFLYSLFRESPERLLPPWDHLALSDRNEFARAEASCIAKGREETSLRLQRDMVRPIVEQRDAALAQLAALQAAAPRWIPTSERLPEVGGNPVPFAVRDDGFRFGVLYRSAHGNLSWIAEDGEYSLEDVTHYMPLPPLPSEET